MAAAVRSEGFNKAVITLSVMLASIMIALDSTIANVALPHIQGSVSAGQDQIIWVLTSYIVAAAIMTPLTGWLSARFGRKLLFLVSIGGFTAVSMLCGLANSLLEIVAFRLLQGLFGASMIPLSQAVLLDINPPERHGEAMALWGMGTVLGPILGPVLGGWLTDTLSWRWVFYINLPIGILAFIGVLLFIQETPLQSRRFDFFGYITLALAIGGIQMFLDRGSTEDWLSSLEVKVYLVVAVVSFYLFMVQSFTARHPFIPRAIFADGNFLTACLFGFMLGILLYSSLALLPPMMENLLGYPVAYTGVVSVPRGVGSLLAMFIVPTMMRTMDTRLIVFIGLSISAAALFQMTHFSLGMPAMPIMVSGLMQGIGTGIVFVPLSTLAFATLNISFRTEAAALFNLIRNMGSSVGISVMQVLLTNNIQQAHATLSEHATRDNPLFRNPHLPFNLNSLEGLAALNGEITRQAAMVAYIDDFKLMLGITLFSIPLLVLMRPPRRGGAPAAQDSHMAPE